MSIEQVAEFADKFGLPRNAVPSVLDEEMFLFRLRRMQDELLEFDEAFSSWETAKISTEDELRDYTVESLDALLDLVYLAYGTALAMGVTPEQWHASFEAVHKANMGKVLAKEPSATRYGVSYDLIKPEGWTGPEVTIKKILFKE